jgi:hypothetical protein
MIGGAEERAAIGLVKEHVVWRGGEKIFKGHVKKGGDDERNVFSPREFGKETLNFQHSTRLLPEHRNCTLCLKL